MMSATAPLALLLCALLVAAPALATIPHTASAPSLSTTTWKTCGEGDFQVTAADLQPDTITPGTSATFTIDVVGGAKEVAGGAYVKMLVRLSGLPIYTQRVDLCSKTACPVASGAAAQLKFSQDFPVYTPPGSYTVTLVGHGEDGGQLFCVSIAFRVELRSLARHRKALA
jgi:hypothetical protein